MIVNLPGPNRPYDPMMNSDVGDSQKVGNPVLQQGKKDQHDKKVKMNLDVAPGEVNQYSRRGHESHRNGSGLQTPAEPFDTSESSE